MNPVLRDPALRPRGTFPNRNTRLSASSE